MSEQILKKWTKEDLQVHIKANVNDPYSASVVMAGMYKAIFGEIPTIGLSGHQASGADFICSQIDNMMKN